MKTDKDILILGNKWIKENHNPNTIAGKIPQVRGWAYLVGSLAYLAGYRKAEADMKVLLAAYKESAIEALDEMNKRI